MGKKSFKSRRSPPGKGSSIGRAASAPSTDENSHPNGVGARAGRGATTRAAVPTPASHGGRREIDSVDFRLMPPPPPRQQKGGAELCLKALADAAPSAAIDGSDDGGDDGAGGEKWHLYVRKSRYWVGDCGAGGKDNQMRRCWLIAIARRPGEVRCFVVDGPRATDLKVTVPSADIVCSCLASLMKDGGRGGGSGWNKPSSLVVCPLGMPGLRYGHAKSLASDLAEALKSRSLPVAVPEECVEIPDDAQASICKAGLKASVLDAEVEPVWLTFQSFVEAEMEWHEDKMNSMHMSSGLPEMSCRLAGYHEKSRQPNDPGHGVNHGASVSSLRDLFAASKEYHEAAPWTVLSNDEYLHLRDEKSGQEAYAMVLGHTEYEGRGINVYETLDDCLKSYRDGPKAYTKGWLDRLQYQEPNLVSFGTLDDISYLDLPLVDEPNAENVPHWCRSRTGIPSGKNHEELVRVWGTPPPHERWPFLAKVLRATALYALDPDLASRTERCNPMVLSSAPASLAGLTVRGKLFSNPQCPTSSLSSYFTRMTVTRSSETFHVNTDDLFAVDPSDLFSMSR